MFDGLQILSDTTKHDQPRSNTIKQHQTRCPNGKMFGNQTIFDGVWWPNISRLSRPLRTCTVLIASIKFSVDCSLRLDLSIRGCSMVVKYLESWYVWDPQNDTIGRIGISGLCSFGSLWSFGDCSIEHLSRSSVECQRRQLTTTTTTTTTQANTRLGPLTWWYHGGETVMVQVQACQLQIMRRCLHQSNHCHFHLQSKRKDGSKPCYSTQSGSVHMCPCISMQLTCHKHVRKKDRIRVFPWLSATKTWGTVAIVTSEVALRRASSASWNIGQ